MKSFLQCRRNYKGLISRTVRSSISRTVRKPSTSKYAIIRNFDKLWNFHNLIFVCFKFLRDQATETVKGFLQNFQTVEINFFLLWKLNFRMLGCQNDFGRKGRGVRATKINISWSRKNEIMKNKNFLTKYFK